MEAERFYWIVAGLVYLYTSYKFRHSKLFLLIILFFFEGLFTYWGILTWNTYKIFLPVYALALLIINQRYIKLSLADKRILWFFALFSLTFVISSIINHDYLLLFLNQYSRYLLPVIIVLLVKAYYKRYGDFKLLKRLFWFLLNIQIGMSVLNFFLMGVHEPIVGTLSSNGGSAATILPVLGFLLLWIEKMGVFSRRDWLYTILLAFIGFVSAKRAIWIIMPVFIFIFAFYVSRRKFRREYSLVALLVPLLFYFGVRLNPTLNKEEKIWGSFDFGYFYNYSKSYTFGNEELTGDLVVGRGGATLYALEAIFSSDYKKMFFGNGLINMYAYDEGSLENLNSPIRISRLNSITMATGLFQNYYTTGLVGVLLFLLLMWNIFKLIRNRRIKVVVSLFFLWEYLLYANNLVRTPALFSLLILIIVISNEAYQKSTIRPQPNAE